MLHTLVSKQVDNFDEHASGYSKFQIPNSRILYLNPLGFDICRHIGLRDWNLLEKKIVIKMNEFIKMSIELFQPIMTVIFAWNKRRSEHKNSTECNPAQQIFHRHKMVCNGTNCFLKDHAFKLILRIHFLSCSPCVITHFSNSKNKPYLFFVIVVFVKRIILIGQKINENWIFFL